MKVHSKIDLFNIIEMLLFCLALAVPFFAFGFVWWYLVLYLLVSAWILFTNFFTFYSLGDGGLEIRSGFERFVVPYETISSITLVKAARFSCNTALACVMIEYTHFKGTKPTKLYISPKKEEEFLQSLVSKCGQDVRIKNLRSK